MRAILSFLLFAILGFYIPWQNLAAASGGWEKNAHLLPQYCQDRAKGWQSPQFQKWRKRLGKAYIHMHHYCKGIYAEKNARTTSDRRKRSRFLQTVVHQMRYVSGSCQAGCVLYPDLHSRWGWALGKQRQFSEAIEHFQLAIKNKPTYTKAYAELSDLYLAYNEPDEARRVLEAGLKISPNSRRLQRKLGKLQTSK